MTGTMTSNMNEINLQNLKAERELTRIDNALNLIKEIKPIRPIYYYNRLICTLFPKSEFAQTVGSNYDYETNRTITNMRNTLIRKAIRDNIHENTIRLNPNCIFSDIDDTLTRNDHGIASGFTREKVFLVSLAFNLKYDEMCNLLSHCLGERKINFRDPYESTLAYCLIKHTNACENYLRLVSIYEDKRKESNINTESVGTQFYENKFSHIVSDKDLIDYLLTLPNDTESTTALVVFKEVFDDIFNAVNDNTKGEVLDEILFQQKKENVFWSIDSIYKDKEYSKKINKEKLVSFAQVADEIIGGEFTKHGVFDFLNKKVFSQQELKDILDGRQKVTKENLTLVLFYRYCILGERADVIEEYYKNDNPNGFTLLEKIYADFKSKISADLEDAGFSDIYLPNAFERFIVFCLISENPIEMFKFIINSKKREVD